MRIMSEEEQIRLLTLLYDTVNLDDVLYATSEHYPKSSKKARKEVVAIIKIIPEDIKNSFAEYRRKDLANRLREKADRIEKGQ